MRFLRYGALGLLLSCSGKAVPIGANELDSGGSRAVGGVSGMTGGASPTLGGSAGTAEGARASMGGTMQGSGGSEAGSGNATPGGGASGASAVVEGCAQQLASGDHHVCVLFDDGRVACQGANGLGQLGIGKQSESEPLVLAHAPSVTLIAAGGDHTCITGGGGILCWGDNSYSALGVSQSEVRFAAEPRSVPSTGEFTGGVIQLALGRGHGCALDRLVHGQCWGGNERGDEIIPLSQLGQIGGAPYQILQLGNGEIRLLDGDRLYDVAWTSTDYKQGLSIVRGASNGVIQNSIGPGQDCLLKQSGMVFCKGNGYPDLYSIVADFGRDVVEVKAGDRYTCVRTSAGKVLCRGSLAESDGPGAILATQVPGIERAVELSLGQSHACARLQDGSVWCWGAFSEGGFEAQPTRVTGPGPGQACTSAETPPLWGRPPPVARPVDVLSDAAVGWGQNQCRCALTGQPLEACARDETGVLNGCLQALAPLADAEVACQTEAVWNRVVCSLGCLDTGNLPSECVNPGPQCPPSSGVIQFCLRGYLLCDSTGVEGVDATRTCDGVRDCSNGFDEANCTAKGRFTCANGSTIALDLVHDGVAQCLDSSDEWLL